MTKAIDVLHEGVGRVAQRAFLEAVLDGTPPNYMDGHTRGLNENEKFGVSTGMFSVGEYDVTAEVILYVRPKGMEHDVD